LKNITKNISTFYIYGQNVVAVEGEKGGYEGNEWEGIPFLVGRNGRLQERFCRRVPPKCSVRWLH